MVAIESRHSYDLTENPNNGDLHSGAFPLPLLKIFFGMFENLGKGREV
jgi:hypothetical protein